MSINPLNHYSLENPASIYDEEAMTALELVGRTAAKLNETVKAFNELEQNAEQRLDNQDSNIARMENETIPETVTQEIDKQISNGTFDEAINEYAGDIKSRVDNLFQSYTPGSTTVDAEISDARITAGGQLMGTIGAAHRKEYKILKNIINGWHNTEVKGYAEWTNSLYYDLTSETVLTINHYDSNINGYAIQPHDIFSSSVLVIDFTMTKTPYQGGNTTIKDYIQVIVADGHTNLGKNHKKYCYLFEPGTKHLEIDLSTLSFVPVRVLFIAGGESNNSVFTISNISFAQKRKEEENPDEAIRNNNELVHGFNTVTPWICTDTIPYGDAVTIIFDKYVVSGAGNYGIQIPVGITNTNNKVYVDFYAYHELTGKGGSIYAQRDSADYAHLVSHFYADGQTRAEFDPTYFQKNYGFIPEYILIEFNIGTTSTTTGYFNNLRVYQNPLIDSGFEGDRVKDILAKVGNEVSVAKSANEFPDTKYYRDTLQLSDYRYFLTINTLGQLAKKSTAADYYCFIGNDILCGHENPSFGMASSAPTNSYATLFNRAMKELNYGGDVIYYRDGREWENTTNVDNLIEIENIWEEDFANKEDVPMMFIVQLGDNIDTAEKVELFKEGCKRLMRKLYSITYTNLPARVVWVGPWFQSPEIQKIITDACKVCGTEYINISDLNTPDNQAKIGDTYTTADGVVHTITDAAHASFPNDKGHKEIANRLLWKLGITETDKYFE